MTKEGEIPFEWMVFRTMILFVWLGFAIRLATVWRNWVDIPCMEIANQVEDFATGAKPIAFGWWRIRKGEKSEAV